MVKILRKSFLLILFSLLILLCFGKVSSDEPRCGVKSLYKSFWLFFFIVDFVMFLKKRALGGLGIPNPLVKLIGLMSFARGLGFSQPRSACFLLTSISCFANKKCYY